MKKNSISKTTFEDVNNNDSVSSKSINLEDVYKVVDKWLYLPDKRIIDVILATALTREARCGDHIFLFIVGNSGDAKSELIRCLDDLEAVNKAIKLDQLTSKAFVSGKKNAKDIGHFLNGKDMLILIPDMANLSSLNKDTKREVWSQFRTLYDGYLYKTTGEGVETEKKYKNINVCIIAGTTPTIYNEYIVHSELGTRELLYLTDSKNNVEKSLKARDNRKYKNKMRNELKSIFYKFLEQKSFNNNIEIPKDIKEFITQETCKLSVLRAIAQTDPRYYELINMVYPEIPTRASIQFELLYISLKSLQSNYPDKRFKEIIRHIVNSSGFQVRQDILNLFTNNTTEKYSLGQIRNKLRLGRDITKRELEILWNMKVLNKTIETDFIGRKEVVDSKGNVIHSKAGRIQEITKYQFNNNLDNPLKMM